MLNHVFLLLVELDIPSFRLVGALISPEVGRRRLGLAPGPGGVAANAVGGQGEGEASLGGDGR